MRRSDRSEVTGLVKDGFRFTQIKAGFTVRASESSRSSVGPSEVSKVENQGSPREPKSVRSKKRGSESKKAAKKASTLEARREPLLDDTPNVVEKEIRDGRQESEHVDAFGRVLMR